LCTEIGKIMAHSTRRLDQAWTRLAHTTQRDVVSCITGGFDGETKNFIGIAIIDENKSKRIKCTSLLLIITGESAVQ
jgi:hypothetical protein